MYETHSTVIGTVITDPRRRTTNTGEEVISFRVASTVRYRVPGTDTWQDGATLYLTVSCWRRLVTGVGAAIGKGSPVIVHGMISTDEYVTEDGQDRSDLKMQAIAVGLDLARYICRVEPARKVGPTVNEEAAAAEQEEALPADHALAGAPADGVGDATEPAAEREYASMPA